MGQKVASTSASEYHRPRELITRVLLWKDRLDYRLFGKGQPVTAVFSIPTAQLHKIGDSTTSYRQGRNLTVGEELLKLVHLPIQFLLHEVGVYHRHGEVCVAKGFTHRPKRFSVHVVRTVSAYDAADILREKLDW